MKKSTLWGPKIYRVGVIKLWFCFGLISDSDGKNRSTLDLSKTQQECAQNGNYVLGPLLIREAVLGPFEHAQHKDSSSSSSILPHAISLLRLATYLQQKNYFRTLTNFSALSAVAVLSDLCACSVRLLSVHVRALSALYAESFDF
jgi:hypothetical protein